MGILNVTPDSFSDGGRSTTPRAAADRALRALRDGADIIDVGGESTRPGAEPISEAEQIRRTVPAIAAIREAAPDTLISIDTTRAAVAEAALDAGASIINDVSGATDDPDILGLAAARDAGLVLMHRRLAPKDDAYSTQYAREPSFEGGVVDAVSRALVRLRDAALGAGIAPDHLVLDPGLGFGKSVAQNWALVEASGGLLSLGHAILAGASRKSFVGEALRAATGIAEAPAPDRRDVASAAVATAQYLMGVRLFRVHHVRIHAEALAVADAIHHGE